MAPAPHAAATRTLLRFAIVLTFLTLLSGIAVRESTRKLGEVGAATRLQATHSIELVHGHAFLWGVVLPLAMAGALALARQAGGSEVSPVALRWLTRGYLPFAALSLALLLYKGYHVLLLVRGGETDFAVVEGALFGGLAWLRYGLYGLAHAGMAIPLGVFLVALWRSLSTSR